MAHISALGAGLYTTIAYTTVAANSTHSSNRSDGDYQTIFSDFDSTASADAASAAALPFSRVSNVREIPSFGTPANIVNVPVYGQATASQIQAQAEAPTLEITLNYVPSLLTDIQTRVGDGNLYYFAFHLLNSDPAGSTDARFETRTTAGGIGGTTTAAQQNTSFFFVGKFEALLVTPSLSDTNQATLTLSAQTEFSDATTITAA